MHPIISIFSIYDSDYNRKIRVLDFFIRLIIPITFTLFEIYMKGNPDYQKMIKKRDTRYRDLSLVEFFPNIQQVDFNLYSY